MEFRYQNVYISWSKYHLFWHLGYLFSPSNMFKLSINHYDTLFMNNKHILFASNFESAKYQTLQIQNWKQPCCNWMCLYAYDHRTVGFISWKTRTTSRRNRRSKGQILEKCVFIFGWGLKKNFLGTLFLGVQVLQSESVAKCKCCKLQVASRKVAS